jgi:CpeT protein
MKFDVAHEAASQLAGAFYNAKQAAQAEKKRIETGQELADFFPIIVIGVPIWQERTDAYWLYLHQGVAPNQEHQRYDVENGKLIEMYGPYRSRVYRISELHSSHVVVQMFSIQNESRFYAAPFFPVVLQDLEESDLIPIAGGYVDLILNPSANAFAGGTRGKSCKREYRGAEFVQTTVTLKPGMLCSLDQGFKGDWEYVWGSQLGPYEFERFTASVVKQLENKTVTTGEAVNYPGATK